LHLFELSVNMSAVEIMERPVAGYTPAARRDLGTCHRPLQLLQVSCHSALTI